VKKRSETGDNTVPREKDLTRTSLAAAAHGGSLREYK
jgi:hypothetical protein